MALDTSFEHLSICITKNDSPLVNFFSCSNRKNSEIIFTTINNLLKSIGIKLGEIDIYIINCGPGSYTGVRIGMAIIKTFAQVFKKPIIPVNSLELIAGQIKNIKKDFCVLLNCTSREIFHCNFNIIDDYPVSNSPIHLSNLEIFLEKSNHNSVLLYRVSPEKRAPEPMFEKLNTIKPDLLIPDGILLDSIGAKKLKKQSFDSMHVQPIYIKREI